MTPQDCHASRLLAFILAQRPEFGSAGYLARNLRGITAAELLTKLHSPTHPGPGPAQRPDERA